MSLIAFILMKTGKSNTEYSGTFYSGIIITFVAAATVIYEIDKWSLIKKSIIHFLIMFATVFPTLVFSGWFANDNLMDILFIFILFITVGIISWVIGIVISKLINKNNQL